MNFADTLRGLLRRWYITFPGIVLAIAVALGAWVIVPPSYERTATQLLLPGNGNIPANANPLLYLGGLSFAADVLVRAVGSESNLNAIKVQHPDAQVTVTRDDTSGGPFIVVTVDAPTDAEAGEVVSTFIDRTAAELESLQESQKIATKYRITVVPVAEDDKGTLQQRTRLVATIGGGVVILALSLLIAGLVDGLSRRRRIAPVALPHGADALPPGTDRRPASRLARMVWRRADASKADRVEGSSSTSHRAP
jgi:hypothetical protein